MIDANLSLSPIYVANLLGVILLGIMMVSTRWRLREKTKENTLITCMLAISFVACIADPVAFSMDGVPGAPARMLVFGGNSLLFGAVQAAALMWISFLCVHLNITLSRVHIGVLRGIAALGILAIAVNAFVPLVFRVDENNVYSRGPLYWMFLLLALFLIVDSLVLYISIRRKGGLLKLFPVWAFIIPIVIGTTIQTCFYGLSLIWSSVTISLTGLLISMQNELILKDKLTGMYNRAYLDYLENNLFNRRETIMTGLMIDVNDFKNINDIHGHFEGDRALKEVAGVLRKSVGEFGTVIRYAGDEFVVLVNASGDKSAESFVNKIRTDLEEFNENSRNSYRLSVAIGAGKFNTRTTSIDEFLNTIDKKMYEDKVRYYKNSPEHDRRRRRD